MFFKKLTSLESFGLFKIEICDDLLLESFHRCCENNKVLNSDIEGRLCSCLPAQLRILWLRTVSNSATGLYQHCFCFPPALKKQWSSQTAQDCHYLSSFDLLPSCSSGLKQDDRPRVWHLSLLKVSSHVTYASDVLHHPPLLVHATRTPCLHFLCF